MSERIGSCDRCRGWRAWLGIAAVIINTGISARAQDADPASIDDFDDFGFGSLVLDSPPKTIDAPLTVLQMRQIARAALVLGTNSEANLKSYRSTLNAWGDSPYLRRATARVIPEALRPAQGNTLTALDCLRGSIEVIAIQKLDIEEIISTYDPQRVARPATEGDDERLSLEYQTETLREIRAFVDVCVYGRIEAVHLVVGAHLDRAHHDLEDTQAALLDDWRGPFEEQVEESAQAGHTLTDAATLNLGLESRLLHAAAEERALMAMSDEVELAFATLQQGYEKLADDLAVWISGCPSDLPAMPGRAETFFTAAAGVTPTRDVNFAVVTYFHVASMKSVDTELSERFGLDVRDGMRDLFHLGDDGRRTDAYIGELAWFSKVTFPDLVIPRARRPQAQNAVSWDLDDSPYPDVLVARVPTVEGVRRYGTGLPSKATNDWSWLVPESVCTAHKLNGRWMVLVIHGRGLFDLEGRQPEVSWAPADRHLKYVRLGASRFGEDDDWHALWNQLKGEQRDWRGQDCYMVGVRLRPESWPADYAVRLGDLSVTWTLPSSPNLASTRFVQETAAPMVEVEPIWCGFSNQAVYVEIRTSADVPSADKIPFQLFGATSLGATSLVRFGSTLSESVLYAHATADPHLFRSRAIVLKHQGVAANTMSPARAVVGAMAYERLAARIVPHAVVGQDKRLGLLAYRTGPELVGASWRDAVRDASAVSGIVPSKPWNELTRKELNAFVGEPWTTVNSTTYVRAGGRAVSLQIGDLAAMLMVRKAFIAQMRAKITELSQLEKRVGDDAEAAEYARELLRPIAEPWDAPIGSLRVDLQRLGSTASEQVPFRTVYDEAWLKSVFKDSFLERRRWLDRATKTVLGQYVEAASKTTVDAADVNPREAKALLRLTAIGMQPVAERLRSCVVRATSVNGVDGVELDPVARGYLRTIRQLGAEFVANEALMDQYNARLALVAAGFSMFTPTTVVQAWVSLGVSSAAMSATLVHELPEYFQRRRDIEFALGAYAVTGPERYGVAKLRAKPGWAMILELAGGSIDCSMALGKLALQVRQARLVADADVAEALGSVHVLMEFDRQSQRYVLARIVEVASAREAGRALNAIETTIAERASTLLDQPGIRPVLEDAVTVGGQRAAAPAGARSIDLNSGERLTETVRYQLEVPGTLVLAEDTHVATILTHDATATVRDLSSWAETVTAMDRGLTLAADRVWNGHVVGERIGKGAFLFVYELPEQAGAVLKVSHGAGDPSELLARIQHCLKLMGDDIPQLAVRDAREIGGVAAIVQDRIAEASYMLRRVKAPVAERSAAHAAEVAELETVAGKTKPAALRTVGVARPGAAKVVTMEADETRAVCELYQRFLDQGLVWYDGHLGNVVFSGKGANTSAAVLDQDFIWKWSDSFWAGPVGDSVGQTLAEVYKLQQKVIRERLPSMLGARLPERSRWMLNAGQHLYPDAEYFMLKMLEFHGYVNYIPGRGFVDGAAKLDDVLEFMPAMRRRLNDLVNPDLNRMVKPRTRRQSRVPLWNVAPCIAALRAA